MGKQYIYQIARLTKKHGQREVLKDIWLAFYPGAKIGVLGKNGSGKSTLLRIMAGMDREFEGEAELTNGFTVGYLSQEPQLNPEKDVAGNVEEAVEPTRAILAASTRSTPSWAKTCRPSRWTSCWTSRPRCRTRSRRYNAWELDRQVEIAMDAMNLPPGDADVTTLSGGERRRVALCKILLEQPDLLLLDEPTNHLDAESVAWLERHLAEYTGTVVAVTHDRYFLDNVAGWILELDRGQGIPWEGNYSSWLEQKKNRLAAEEKAASARQKSLASELEWIRMAPRARQAKNKARIKAFEELSQAAALDRENELEIQIPASKHLGDLVIECQARLQGFWRSIAHRRLELSLAGRWHRGRDRSQRRGQDHAVSHDHRRRRARQRRSSAAATPSSWATSIKAATR